MKKNNPLGCFFMKKWQKILLEMKILSFLILVLSFSATAKSYSQHQRVSMEMEQATILDVLNEIKEQTGLRFVYYKNMFDEYGKVDIEVEDEEVKVILDELLREKGLECEVEEEVITFREVVKPAPVPVKQEKNKVTGKITDEEGIPLPGVSVLVKGSTIGVATNIDGEYNIEFNNENAVLVFSFVGMLSQEISFGGKNEINVTLFPDTEQMEEVVVTGYQTISKERSTGSYAIVKADDITSLETSLQGKLEGLTTGVLNSSFGDGNFMASYLPDSDNDNRLIMRGISTMSENSSPLVVIDGFPSQEGLSSVNPNDIDQVTFLKDAAAASIWGSQSSNGVIVITTKKGTQSKPKVSYKFTHQYIPKWDLDYLNKASADETITFIEEVFDGAPSAFHNQWSPTELGYLMIDHKNGVIDDATYAAGVAEIRARGDNFGQIKDELLETGAIQQHDLAIAGGSEKMNYRAAINYIKKKGGFVGNENEKINLSLNNDIKINDRFKVSLGFNFIYEDVSYSPLYASEPGYSGRQVVVDRITPWELLKDENGNYLDQTRGYLGSAMGLRGQVDYRRSQQILDQYGLNTFNNILHDMDRQKRGYDSYMARLKSSIDYKIIDGLTFNGGFQYERGNRTDKRFWAADSRAVQQTRAAYTLTDWFGNVTEERIPPGAIQNVNTGSSYSYTLRGTLNYRKDFNKHSFTVLGGGEISKYYNEFYRSTQFGYDPNTLIETPVDVTKLTGYIFPTLTQYAFFFGSLDDFNKVTSRDDRYVSYFGNFAYTFDSKYVLNASGRIDNFNLYGGDSRFNKKPLWSVGAGWNISNEDFVEEIDWIDNLKLTYTYGSNGNVARGAIPELQIRQFIESEHGDLAGTIVAPKNDALKWEETKTNNIKLDFGLFNGKLSGSVDFYHRKSKDVLSGKELDPTHGLKRVTFNNGTIVNKGFEFELNAAIMQKKDFYWGTRFLLSYNHNEVVNINTSTRSQYPEDLLRGLYSAPGKPTNGIYSFQWAGLNEQGHAQAIDQDGNPSSEYRDMNGTDMLVFSGSVVPKWVGSFTTQFKYKNLELSAMFVGNFGHVMRKDVPNIAMDETVRPHEDVVKRWQKPGDEAFTNIPKIGTRFTEPILADYLWTYADINVVSASWIKLREVNLIYNLPKSLLNKLSIGPSQVMFQVTNPLMWTKNSEGIDPEAHEMAFGRRMMPIMTSYTVGLNINF